MQTIRELNIFTDGENRILKIPEYARYVGLTTKTFENNTFDYAFSQAANTLIHIDEYNDNDKAFCPVCGQKVFPRRGNINKHSFAHFHNESCRGVESDEISDESLNQSINSLSSHHSDLTKLKKFRYKISGQGLVNAIMQIKANKENSENQKFSSDVPSNIADVIELFSSIDVAKIEDLESLINTLQTLLNNVDEKIDHLDSVVRKITDEEILQSGLPLYIRDTITNKGIEIFNK